MPNTVNSAARTSADPGRGLRFGSAPVLKYLSTFRSGAHRKLRPQPGFADGYSVMSSRMKVADTVNSAARTSADPGRGLRLFNSFRGLAVAPGIIAVLITGSAGAQQTAAAPAAAAPASLGPVASPQNASLADRYFYDAKSKAKDKKWDESLALLEKAWSLKQSYDIAGNLGQVALKLEQYKKAATFLETCLRLFPPTGDVEKREMVQGFLQEARTHVAALRVHVSPAEAEVVLDGSESLGQGSELDHAVFVDPGVHCIEARLNGKGIAEQQLTAVAGVSHDINLVPPAQTQPQIAPVTSASPPPGPPASPPANTPGPQPFVEQSESRSPLPLIIGGTVAAVGLVSAVLFLESAHNAVNTAEGISARVGPSGCSAGAPNPANSLDCQALYDANARADKRYNWGYAMLGVGVAALAGSLTYAFWPSQDSSVTRGSAGAPQVGVQLAPSGGGLALSTSF
jgi:tetratricopeptide (TPR) repeat protein